MTIAEATSYQRLREHLAYLGMTAAAEHLSAELDRGLKDKLSATQVLESLLEAPQLRPLQHCGDPLDTHCCLLAGREAVYGSELEWRPYLG